MRLHRENVCPDHLLTDRAAYISYLESQLEHVTSACMTVASFEERLEAATASQRSLTMKVTDISTMADKTHGVANELKSTHGPAIDSLEARMSRLEASAYPLSQGQRRIASGEDAQEPHDGHLSKTADAAGHQDEANVFAKWTPAQEHLVQAKLLEMQNSNDSIVGQRLSRLEAAAAETAAVHEAMQAAVCRQRLEATCQAFRVGMHSLADERLRLSTASDAVTPPDQRAQALAAQLPTSSWNHQAPTQPRPPQPTAHPAAPHPLFQTSPQRHPSAGPGAANSDAIWQAPQFHHYPPHAPHLPHLNAAAGLPPTASPPACQPSPSPFHAQNCCHHQQHPSTGPSLSGWLGPAGNVGGPAANKDSPPAAGSLQRGDCHAAVDVQQGPSSQGQQQRQEIEANLAEQTQAVEGILQGVQASFAALHEAMAETARQQESVRQEQAQMREQEQLRVRKCGDATPAASAGRGRSIISLSELDARSAGAADVDRPTASSLGKLRRSSSPGGGLSPAARAVPKRPWGSPPPALTRSSTMAASGKGQKLRQPTPRRVKTAASLVENGPRRERLKQLYADLKALDEESVAAGSVH
ncbi:hypothetical protein WJX74_010817 [Apatococcus lobatus]|uniref:Uncharacterized protein n=1 Tax=Apatococcus lobatus TaxID=904363 RepID=A0AAW1SC48_9CHLO